MYKYSKKSKQKLAECHGDLQVIFSYVLKEYDNTIIDGHRSPERQLELFKSGKSKVKVGKHNSKPSMAVDVAPYPIDWDDLARFYHFGGYVKAVADVLYKIGKISHKLRWGGDWDRDNNFKDQSFNDLVHFELVK